jgi:hypothetical protein
VKRVKQPSAAARDGARRGRRYHANGVCAAPASSPLPYMDSFMFNKPFEKMRV